MNNTDKIQAAVTNGFLFTAGQRGVGENGNVVSSDVTEQTLKALENLENILTENNSSLGKVQKITVFFTRREDFLPCNLAVKKYFTDKNIPSVKCSSVETQKLPSGVFVEVEAVAKI